MAKKIRYKSNKGRSRDIIAATEWEDIDESEKVRRSRRWSDVPQPINSDIADALAKAQLDANRRFGKR
jgi:hypothetical protein